MLDYLIRKTAAKQFASINPDPYYRYDQDRPMIDIKDGILGKFTPPGAAFYMAKQASTGQDIILFKATEPGLQWYRFADAVVSVCTATGVQTVISIGSMYDNVLHTDTVISAIASNTKLLHELSEKKVNTVTYNGPSAFHSTLHVKALEQGLDSVSLWCHCPYYLQGTMHYGLLLHLGCLLSSWAGFRLETEELEVTWKELNKQIKDIVEKNPELKNMISDLRKAKVKGSLDTAKKQDKVIHLEDFFKPG
jgi:predicted ATP-grasp superfamily ATP-dependent carboligase